MKKIAIIYSFNTRNTSIVAKEIKKVYGPGLDELNAEEINGERFLKYDYLILGVPTWFDGELPNYWDEFVPELETLNLKGKKIALFGNGDQVNYPENFVDGIGILGSILEKKGAVLVGFTSTEGYTFEKSKAVRDGKFIGLALDIENQNKLNAKRIKGWVEGLRKEFK
jgi:flavodoxin I